MNRLRHKVKAAYLYVRVHGIVALLRHMLGRPHPIRMFVEYPHNERYADGCVFAQGWAFSTAGQIARVEAVSRGRVIALLDYGLPRTDVAAHFGIPSAVSSGFTGNFMLPPGEKTVSFRAIDVNGNHFQMAVRFRSEIQMPVQLVIEHALQCGDILTVEGWVVWPGNQRPRTVRYMVDGVEVGTSRCIVSRPDISARFDSHFEAGCHGFRCSMHMPGMADQTDVQVSVSDGSGYTLEQTARIQQQDTVIAGEALAILTQVIDLIITAIDPDPAILDWDVGISNAIPGRNILTPISDQPRLPYLDASIDIVVYADASKFAEAQRIARVAAVCLAAQGAVHWNTGRAPSLPSVSIIIPAFNHASATRACLDELQKTLPFPFEGEIIVANDTSTDETAAMLAAYAARWPLLKPIRNEQNVGFIQTCNRAAAAAIGEFLLFLNNDTLPQAGWLQALLRTFRQYPDAGAVGGKLLNPDGTLQEAGGMVFADGGTMHFGSGSVTPDAPLYHHVREIDYCSGALLMTPRTLFERVGGFDRRYKPAYFEDVDYCFNVRALGYRVLYQPDSVVIHTAHISYSDFRERIAGNRVAFIDKWRGVLNLQPKHDPNPYLAINGHRRHVLVYTSHLPIFDRFGNWLRLLHLVDALIKADWTVTIYARDMTGGARYSALLRQRGVMLYGGEESCGISDEYLRDPVPLLHGARFDLAVASSWWTAVPLAQMLRANSPHTRIVVDACDVHFLREMRATVAERAQLDEAFSRRMIGELNSYAAVDKVLTVSDVEARLIDSLLGSAGHAVAVPNMMRLTPSPVVCQERRGIVFVGNYMYAANVEAMTYLLREVLPLLPDELLCQHPVTIIGQNARETLASIASHQPHVHLVDWVPDDQPYVQHSRIAVVPLLNGAGTKTKLIRALANRTPVVSTWIGTEGTGLEHDHHLLVADSAAEFADAMCRLLTDDVLWERLASAGYEHIRTSHSYEVGAQRFLAVLETIFSEKNLAPYG